MPPFGDFVKMVQDKIKILCFTLLLVTPEEKEAPYMTEAHLSALSEKHADIDDRIHQEEVRPYPDMMELSRLKKMKLKIKEEMVHG